MTRLESAFLDSHVRLWLLGTPKRPGTFIYRVFLPGEIHSDPLTDFSSPLHEVAGRASPHDEKIIAYGRQRHVEVLEV